MALVFLYRTIELSSNQKISVAGVEFILGTLNARSGIASPWRPLLVGDAIFPGTTLSTGEASKATIQLGGGRVIRMGSQTQTTLGHGRADTQRDLFVKVLVGSLKMEQMAPPPSKSWIAKIGDGFVGNSEQLKSYSAEKLPVTVSFGEQKVEINLDAKDQALEVSQPSDGEATVKSTGMKEIPVVVQTIAPEEASQTIATEEASQSKGTAFENQPTGDQEIKKEEVESAPPDLLWREKEFVERVLDPALASIEMRFPESFFLDSASPLAIVPLPRFDPEVYAQASKLNAQIVAGVLDSNGDSEFTEPLDQNTGFLRRRIPQGQLDKGIWNLSLIFGLKAGPGDVFSKRTVQISLRFRESKSEGILLVLQKNRQAEMLSLMNLGAMPGVLSPIVKPTEVAQTRVLVLDVSLLSKTLTQYRKSHSLVSFKYLSLDEKLRLSSQPGVFSVTSSGPGVSVAGVRLSETDADRIKGISENSFLFEGNVQNVVCSPKRILERARASEPNLNSAVLICQQIGASQRSLKAWEVDIATLKDLSLNPEVLSSCQCGLFGVPLERVKL